MQLAKRRIRLLAFLVDVIITLIFAYGLTLLVDCSSFVEEVKIFIDRPLTLDSFNLLLANISTAETLLYMMLLFVFFFLYYCLMPSLFRGKTFGKFVFHIRIIKIDESKPNIGILFVREIIGYFLFGIFTFGLIYLVSFWMMNVKKGHRSFGDCIADTIVVKDKYYISRRR